MKKPPVDFSKPVKTRRGEPVEIVTANGRAPAPVIGYVGDDTIPTRWTRGGWYYVNHTPCDLDLFNAETS
jgi:hypothetical protein